MSFDPCNRLLKIWESIENPSVTCSQVPCWTQVGSKLIKQRNCLELGAHSQLSALKGVEGRAKAPGWTRKRDKL
jgi:hypothetical protein